jgi:hypothetical protein
MTKATIETGNAKTDNTGTGWFVGHFMEKGTLAHTKDVEVKWGAHPKGEERKEWAVAEDRPTLTVLIRGRFVISFPNNEDVVLEKEGDYVLWNDIAHTWRSEGDTLTMCVRWPSRA